MYDVKCLKVILNHTCIETTHLCPRIKIVTSNTFIKDKILILFIVIFNHLELKETPYCYIIRHLSFKNVLGSGASGEIGNLYYVDSKSGIVLDQDVKVLHVFFVQVRVVIVSKETLNIEPKTLLHVHTNSGQSQ